MQVKFGSHFTMSRPVDRQAAKERFPQLGKSSSPYNATLSPGDTYDSLTSVRDENDWKVEEFLQEKGILFTKEPSLEHFKKMMMMMMRDETQATQTAQKEIDKFKDAIEKKPKTGVPSLVDLAARRVWDQLNLPPHLQEALIRNRPGNEPE